MSAASEGQILCDVQDLPAPEPMNAVLTAIDALNEGDYVRMQHRMEPVHLYGVLRDMGFEHRLFLEGEAPYEIMIFRKADAEAQARVEAFCADA